MSIIKYQSIPAYDSGGNPTVVDVTRRNMTKVASYENFGDEMREYLATVKPKEDFAYLLISAMGDQNWGPNRNGDYWPTEALKHAGSDYGHKTYEINGNWYHHHQNKDPNLSYGRVLKSVWNDDMGRIELIVEVDLKKDEKTRTALANNQTIETSMGAKVKFDICKVCHKNWKEFYKIPEDDMIVISKESNLKRIHEIGHKYGVDLSYIKELNSDGGPVGIHSNTSKYCKHMKTQRNQVLPTGEQVCVVNLRPSFFDISYVSVNADKSSFVLAKVAGENMDTTEYPNEDIVDDDIPIKVSAVKEADQIDSPGDGDIDKEVPDGQVIADDYDDIQKYYLEHICPEMHSKEPEIPDKVMDSMAAKYSLPEILSSFLAMGMYPHPREFQRVVMIQMGKSDDLARADAEGDFLRYSDIPPFDHDQELPESLIGIGGDKINPEIMDTLKHFFWDRSQHRRPVVKRMVIIKSAAEKNAYLDPNAPIQQRNIIPGLAASLGTLYAISLMEGKRKLRNIGQDTNKLLGGSNIAAKLGLGIAGVLLLNKVLQSQTDKYAEDKTAAAGSGGAATTTVNPAQASTAKILAKFVGPTAGIYMWGGHIINKARTGQPVSKTEEFIAKHPLELSAATTAAVYRPEFLKRIPKALGEFGRTLMKGAEMGLDMSEINIDDYPLELRDIGGIAVWESIKTVKE